MAWPQSEAVRQTNVLVQDGQVLQGLGFRNPKAIQIQQGTGLTDLVGSGFSLPKGGCPEPAQVSEAKMTPSPKPTRIESLKHQTQKPQIPKP